jgi:hypothetical protein
MEGEGGLFDEIDEFEEEMANDGVDADAIDRVMFNATAVTDEMDALEEEMADDGISELNASTVDVLEEDLEVASAATSPMGTEPEVSFQRT